MYVWVYKCVRVHVYLQMDLLISSQSSVNILQWDHFFSLYWEFTLDLHMSSSLKLSLYRENTTPLFDKNNEIKSGPKT